jgi:hypothetical protein
MSDAEMKLRMEMQKDIQDDLLKGFTKAVALAKSNTNGSKKKLGFTNKVILFMLGFYALAWAVAVAYLFMYGQWLTELVAWPAAVLTPCGVAGFIKSAIENKARIEKDGYND